MFCATSVNTRLVGVFKLALSLAVTGVLCCITSLPVRAMETEISTTVYDGQPAVLNIVAPVPGTVFNSSPVDVTIQVHNIGQVMIYIDGVYSHTVAVDIGSSQVTLSVAVPIGNHDITVQGLDPFTSNSVPDLVSIVYNPSAQPSNGTPSTVPNVIRDARQGVIDTSSYLNQQIDQAATTKPVNNLSTLVHKGMILLDIATPSSNAEAVGKMLLRFWLIVGGTALLVLSHSMFIAYHWIRYQVLKWNIHALPLLVRHHTLFFLRGLGIVLLGIAFLAL